MIELSYELLVEGRSKWPLKPAKAMQRTAKQIAASTNANFHVGNR
jgi:hypothetical protein